MRDKTTAAILGIFLGGVGGHKFYLGETGTGVVFLLFCWTGIPFLIGLIQGLNFLGMNQATFDARYNGRMLPGGYPGNLIVNVSPSIGVAPGYLPPGYPPPGHAHGHPHHPQAAYGTGHAAPYYAAPPLQVPPQPAPQALPPTGGGDVASRIAALHDLKNVGALTEEEFIAAKQKLLVPTGRGS